MSKFPNALVAFAAEHPETNLAVFGVSQRKLATAKVRALVAAHGFTPQGWRIRETITLPRGRPDVVNHVSRELAKRVHTLDRTFYDNGDNPMMKSAFGRLHMVRVSQDESKVTMSAVRAAKDRYLAQLEA